MVTILAACLATNLFVKQGPPATILKQYTLPFGVSLKLPAKPEKWDQPVGDLYVCKTGVSVILISYRKMSGAPGQGPADAQLAASVMGTLDSEPGKLIRFQDAMLHGWPGLEYMVQGKTATEWCRNFVVGDRLVFLQIAYPSTAQAPLFSKQVFDSLALADDTKSGPLTTTDIPFKRMAPKDVPCSLDIPGDLADEAGPMGTGSEALFLHRFHYEYALRNFAFGYADVSDEAAKAATSDGGKKLRQSVANYVLQVAEAKTSDLKTVTRGGNDWTTCSFKITDFASGRVDVLYLDKHIYFLYGAAPNPWLGSPDFKHFFDSFTLTKPS